MPLFDMTGGVLNEIPSTTFADQGVLERVHLQAAIKRQISILGSDLLLIAEEFGAFEDANRRIDLLCVDHSGRPVVVELKRTTDGGHMDLQALRYAAMVSTLTFDDLAEAFEGFLRSEDKDPVLARSLLAGWLEGGEDAEIRRDVRVILAAADFGREITTTALWLNEVFSTDIRCVRITPYRVDHRLLLNVEQVIPLPEAEDLVVRLRRRAAATRAQEHSGQDWTQYVVVAPEGSTVPLRKRWAVLAMTKAVIAAGADAEAVLAVLGHRKFRALDGTVEAPALQDAFSDAFPEADTRRWFLDDPIHVAGRTWVVSNQWGRNTEAALSGLAGLVPESGIYFESE